MFVCQNCSKKIRLIKKHLTLGNVLCVKCFLILYFKLVFRQWKKQMSKMKGFRI